MTWKECKMAAVTKMFGSWNGSVDLERTAVKDYLTAMPWAANEAIQRICESVPLKKTLALELEQREKSVMRDLREEAPDFRGPGNRLQVVLMTADGPQEPENTQLWMNRFLILPPGPAGRLLLAYEAWPEMLDENTADDFALTLAPDAATLVPLYIAGELYKDEDASVATLFMNEFEAKLNDLYTAADSTAENSFAGGTGWC